MSQKEQARLQVLNEVLERGVRVREAALVLGLSERHAWRILAAYRREGAVALAHGNRGRMPPNTIPEEVKREVRELGQGLYEGVNHCHLAELLGEREGIVVSRSSIWRILTRVGVPSSRRRRLPQHRCRRERFPQEGMLLQMDGSRHDWLQGRGPYLTLIAAIDDSTGTVPFALFREQEDAQGYFLLLREIIRRKGIPLAIYTDRHGIFQRSPREPEGVEEQLAGTREPTQFGRALQELGIQSIFARSPQAKGRIERLWGTFQDRLVAELRLGKVNTPGEAGYVLGDFLPRFNLRFGVPPSQPGSAYRQPDPGMCLEGILCFKYRRTVARDNAMRFGGHTIQLLPGLDRLSYAHARVEIQERLDGSLVVTYQGESSQWRSGWTAYCCCRAPGRVKPDGIGAQREGLIGLGPAYKGARPKATHPHTTHKPNPDYPWRRPLLTKSLNN